MAGIKLVEEQPYKLKDKYLKRYFYISFKALTALIISIILVTLALNVWMIAQTEERIYYKIDDIPVNDVAIVLGTSKYNRNGTMNMFFRNRMEATAMLYHSGKIKHIIVSGDNSLSYYNEPQDMKKALMAQGVAAEDITLDYAGFRTFDSIVRSKKIFGQKKITVITQDFHCNRALFIGDFYGMEPIAFSTSPVEGSFTLVMQSREFLARCKAIAELYLLDSQPKFLGEKIEITVE